MHSSCNNCKAIFTNTSGTKCRLGFEINKIITLDTFPEFYPEVPCPKPLTFDKYFAYLQEYKKNNIKIS